MKNIAAHMRISGVTVSDNDVESRQTAAANLATTWGKEKNIESIISKAADIAAALNGDGIPSQELSEEVQACIQKKSPSFLYEERPLDIGVCAGLAVVSILAASPGNTGWTNSDVYAIALWSALAYQPVLSAERRENLRREVLSTAANWSTTSANKARERINVPDPSDVKITVNENYEVTNDFKKAMINTVEALRQNSALDREELDFLWWAQLGRSRLLKKQLSKIAEPTRIVAAGIEGAMMLRRLPCEVHREIVLRTVDKDKELNLAELLEAIGNDRMALSSEFSKTKALNYPSVFPLIYALNTGEINGSGACLKRRVSEWGERALLETTFARMISIGASKI